MSRNKLKRANSIQSRRIWLVGAGAFFVTVLGLVYVALQVRIIQLADDVKVLENRLSETRQKNAALRLQIEHQKSPPILQKRITQFHLQMESMANLPVVTIDRRHSSDVEAYASRQRRVGP